MTRLFNAVQGAFIDAALNAQRDNVNYIIYRDDKGLLTVLPDTAAAPKDSKRIGEVTPQRAFYSLATSKPQSHDTATPEHTTNTFTDRA